MIHFLQDKHSDALRAFQRAIEIKPDYHWPTIIWDTRSKDVAALGAFRAAIHYRSTQQGAHTNAGRILLGQREPTESLRHLRVAVRLAPNDELSRKLFRRATELAGASK